MATQVVTTTIKLGDKVVSKSESRIPIPTLPVVPPIPVPSVSLPSLPTLPTLAAPEVNLKAPKVGLNFNSEEGGDDSGGGISVDIKTPTLPPLPALPLPSLPVVPPIPVPSVSLPSLPTLPTLTAPAVSVKAPKVGLNFNSEDGGDDSGGGVSVAIKTPTLPPLPSLPSLSLPVVPPIPIPSVSLPSLPSLPIPTAPGLPTVSVSAAGDPYPPLNLNSELDVGAPTLATPTIEVTTRVE